LTAGQVHDACLPEGESGVESAVHVDLITDMETAGTSLDIDGEVIQRDGRFRWEDGFEA
jgi:aminopeptidase